jgi:hypothetical protein
VSAIRRLRVLLRDDGVISVALGAALALALVGVGAGLAQMAVGPFRDRSLILVPWLELLLVVAMVVLARPRTGR